MKFSALVTVFLALTLGASLTLLPNADAHSPPWTIISYAYISVSPNPVGVGQTVAVLMWVDYPLPGSSMNNDIRRYDYTLTITKPDSTTETKKWDVITDTTGVQYFQYVPDQTGNYTFFFQYPQQIFTWSGTYNGDIFLAANATTTLVVQEEQVPSAIDSFTLYECVDGICLYAETATNLTGVPITLSVIDSNNNFREIGTVISNADGYFSFSWKPDIEGSYQSLPLLPAVNRIGLPFPSCLSSLILYRQLQLRSQHSRRL